MCGSSLSRAKVFRSGTLCRPVPAAFFYLEFCTFFYFYFYFWHCILFAALHFFLFLFLSLALYMRPVQVLLRRRLPSSACSMRMQERGRGWGGHALGGVIEYYACWRSRCMGLPSGTVSGIAVDLRERHAAGIPFFTIIFIFPCMDCRVGLFQALSWTSERDMRRVYI